MTASTAPALRRPEPGALGVRPGRLVIDRHPLLAAHRGAAPDLVLCWGPMPRRARVDVVVHLHGFGTCGPMDLVRDILPRSGFDPARRRAPTLFVLPRGHFYGGRTRAGYDFPGLVARGALSALVDDALGRFAAATGAHPTPGRLILTAHSGGGAALMRILRQEDPDEIHTFDALYEDPAPLIAWAKRRRSAGTGALRVLYRAGRHGTAAMSERVRAELGGNTRTFRVERTEVEHCDIPRTYGPRLLADPAADLPGVAAIPGTPAEQRESTPPPTLGEAIAAVAVREFRRWRPGGGRPLTETTPQATPMLRQYYLVGLGKKVSDMVSDADLRSAAWHAHSDMSAWSAAFVSYVMREAGASMFPAAAAHREYIRAARRNRLVANSANPFWAYRATEIAPRVGDLVCNSRPGVDGANYDNIGQNRRWSTHCDIVVDVKPGRLRVIGGNVGMPGGPPGQGLTVGDKTVWTLPDGRVDLRRHRRIFAVVSCSGARPVITAAPATGTAAPPCRAGAPLPASTDERAARVVQLLVSRYGYPVAGAAGLTGNLIAESEVIPQRIEGSRSATPLRAKDFSGRERDFTPDEVRDRDPVRRTGPRLPGVGLAQWTRKERRAGLFRHRSLGSAILSDLAAQVDYLVTELGRDYRQVDAVLRGPGVTVDRASDAVLLRFEVPAVVVNGRPGDPALQKALRDRRALGARALAAYRRTAPVAFPTGTAR
ncbi:phage tail tip lysozyme [Paractinoplanes rhizophilus]|uniref:Phage tail tip lysozyme n=1 Tax=Paractinoplanes rhizophilus TaxID=1416877 RepID=A0ABW2I488_9ACTN